MANMIQMMQKAQQFKARMQALQERMQETEVSGASGGGLVTCRVSGKFELKTLKVNPSLVADGDVGVLEDMIVAAVNDARRKAEDMMAAETKKLMQDMGLPPGLGLPF